MSGVETRVFGGVGIWSVGKGRRGKKRREAEGSRGKDDARRSTGRGRGGGERLAVAVGGQAGTRGGAKDAK